MTHSDSDNITNEENKSNEGFDLIEALKAIWKGRKLVFISCGIAFVISLIIAFSIPKEYTTNVVLAPESSDNKSVTGGLSALAAAAGVGLGSSQDAVYPKLYPEIMKSLPFVVSLFDVDVKTSDNQEVTVKEYLENDIKSPWWSVITNLPRNIIGALSSDDNADAAGGDASKGPDPFKLSRKETMLARSIQGRVTGAFDRKTSIVTISVTMQDPMVAAMLADTAVNHLRGYVTNYRTSKARKDMEYLEQLNNEARANYYAAQQRFADYLDTHQGIVLNSARTVRDRLENEAMVAFNLYNQTTQQLQLAKAKVQEETPVFAVITPSTVALKPSAPRKGWIIVGLTFLTFVGSCCWILFISPILNQKRNKKEA